LRIASTQIEVGQEANQKKQDKITYHTDQEHTVIRQSTTGLAMAFAYRIRPGNWGIMLDFEALKD